MKVIYADTSAVGKLLLCEPETAALKAFLDAEDAQLVSTDLLETELRRVAVRERIDQTAATLVLDAFTLHELPRSGYREAGQLSDPALRSLDALHLIGALRLRAQGVLTYDDRLAAAAAVVGLAVYAPGS